MKGRLVLNFCAAVVITGVIAVAAGLRLIGDRVVAEMQAKVRNDLNTAREVYETALRDVKASVEHVADRTFIIDAAARRDSTRLGRDLKSLKEKEALDLLMVVDRGGRILGRPGRGVAPAADFSGDALLQRSLQRGEPAASTMIVPLKQLLEAGEGLADQAHFRLVPTPMEHKTGAIEETSGMALAAAAPILDGRGRLLGAVYGGRLLNRNFAIVDKVKMILYRGMTYKGKDVGTATIFQGDLRIATNVHNRDGSRAIGTRVSAPVAEKVLREGQTWFDRAFVVNDWFITAYEPIRDIAGRVVGILYVGVLEQKYKDVRRQVFITFIGAVAAGMAVAVAMAYMLSGVIMGPIREMIGASRRLTAGDLSARVGIAAPEEFALLGETFNAMAKAVQERDEQVKRRAQERVESAEKLAVLGRLAAGVAHEINNPLGGILLYSHLLMDDTPKDDPRRANMEKIAGQTVRCRDIVKGLLDFARQTELRVEDGDVNELILKTLGLVENLVQFHHVRVEKDLDGALAPIRMDRGQLQQVLLNIFMNAAQAMEAGGGTLTAATRRGGDGQVEIRVTDTGCGITPENLKRVFEPFFTTKAPGQGLGLGLAISYGIVERHGGTLGIASEQGRGTTVTILLPASGRA